MNIPLHQPNGTIVVIESLEDFFSYFGVHYCKHLAFSASLDVGAVRDLCPYIHRFLHRLGFFKFNHREDLEQFLRGDLVATSIRWINSKMGYGLFAEQELQKGTYLGEYTGLVRRWCLGEETTYAVQYPTKSGIYNTYIIDAKSYGNETRFINHHERPNLRIECVVRKSLLHFVFFAVRDIAIGEELTCHYGDDYWQYRRCQ